MNILIFNTTTPVCSVGLAVNGITKSLASDQLFQHGEKLLGFIQELLSQRELELADIDLLGVVNGPGSFVGTRLGCAVAQSIAFSLAIPVCLISTLDGIAQSVLLQTGHERIILIQDARLQQVYIAEYCVNKAGIMCLVGEQRLLPLSEAGTQVFQADVIVGDGVSLWKRYNPDFEGEVLAEVEINVSALHALTTYFWEQGHRVSDVEIMPRYS